MSLFGTFRFVNGRAVAGTRTLVQRETGQPKRTDNNNFLTPPLEIKAFEGNRATTAQGAANRGWEVALTGQVATTAKGNVSAQKRYYELLDNFTNSNGTGITSHTSEAPWSWSWAAYNYTVEPTIQTNRLQGPGASDTAQIWCASAWTPTVVAENDFWLEVSLYRRNTTAGATTGIVNNGVFVRGSATNRDGFLIGWNELDDEFYILDYAGGVLSSTLGQAFGTGAFTGTSQERKLLIHVYSYSPSPPYYNVHIGVYVDSGSGYNANEDFYGDAFGSLYGGTAYYEVGTVFEETNGVDVDWIRLYDDLVQLEGARLTTASGYVKDHFQPLVGFASTTAAGTISGSTGSETSVALTGQSATTAQGTITPDTSSVIIGLTGLAATATQGTIVPALVVVTDPAIGALSPRVSWTYHTDANKLNPGNIGTQFLPWDGVLYGAGNHGTEESLQRFPRSGLKKVSQVTEETNPWTSNAKWTFSDNSGMAVDDTSNPFLIGSYFPRGFAGSQDPGPRYNTIYSKGGWLSMSPQGNVFSAVERVYDKMGGAAIFLAPHFGEVASPNYYNGPELFTGYTTVTDEVEPERQRYQTSAPLGVYPLSENEAIAFYPQIIDGRISGRFADLVGVRATTRIGTITPSYTSGTNPDIPLVGFAATTAYGRLSIAEAPEVQLEAGPGHQLSATAGVLYARDASIVPAIKRLKNGTWTSTPVLADSFTGATKIWTRSHYLTVVPSGYGDVIYATYYSEAHASHPAKIGVVVMDAASGAVHSNTLYSVSGSPFTRFTDGASAFGQALDETWRPFGTHRTVALTHKLSSGTSVTQFLFCGEVVHFSWTSGTATAPTVTIKNGASLGTTESVFPAWQTLEVRGDNVYHVVPYGNNVFGIGGTYDGGASIYVNDATGTSSTWTTPSVSVSESGTKDTARDLPVFYGGFGGKRKSWWFLSWWEVSFSVLEEGSDAGWFDLWYLQPKLISVEAMALLGRVTLTIDEANKTVALTGNGATTANGTLYADITYQRQLTGQVATTAYGIIVPEGGDIIAALSGQAATTAYGTLTPSLGGVAVSIGLVHGHLDTFIGVITIPIVEAPGLAAVTAQGALGLAIDQAPGATGLVATAAQGVIAPEVAPSLLGEDATGSVGQPVPQIAAPEWSWGLHSDALAGSLGRFAEDLAQLVGNAAAATQGDVSPVVGEESSVSGQSATSAAGVLTPVVLVTLNGHQTTSGQGVVTANLVYQLTGLSTTTQEGFLSIIEEIFLSGRSATTASGVVGYQYGGTVTAVGLEMYLQLGDVSQNMRKATTDQFLWALRRIDEEFVQESLDDENPVVAPNE